MWSTLQEQNGICGGKDKWVLALKKKVGGSCLQKISGVFLGGGLQNERDVCVVVILLMGL